MKGSVLQDVDDKCSCRSEVPKIPSWGSNNLVDQLTELREIYWSLDYRFIIKGCNSGIDAQIDARDAQGKVRAKGKELPCSSSAPFSLNLHVFNNPEALQTLSFWGFYGGFIP